VAAATVAVARTRFCSLVRGASAAGGQLRLRSSRGLRGRDLRGVLAGAGLVAGALLAGGLGRGLGLGLLGQLGGNGASLIGGVGQRGGRVGRGGAVLIRGVSFSPGSIALCDRPYTHSNTS